MSTKGLCILLLTSGIVLPIDPPIPKVALVDPAVIKVILPPPPKERIVLFQYPPGINKADFSGWVVEACDPRQDGFHWHTINSTMDSNKLITVPAYGEAMIYRVKGIHK